MDPTLSKALDSDSDLLHRLVLVPGAAAQGCQGEEETSAPEKERRRGSGWDGRRQWRGGGEAGEEGRRGACLQISAGGGGESTGNKVRCQPAVDSVSARSSGTLPAAPQAG
ncbi:putative RNA-binding protein 15B isoform X2 [Eriocheir sinensis]|uniref:putative RNA-binding protein 15B isoform X2 n=1 Tax=Eriocheir sinensis TaxID=95602 RepID=UPI0021C77078|nr:putative RNA-binding protein 15B isoform X2 [Eriocheir sinensis]